MNVMLAHQPKEPRDVLFSLTPNLLRIANSSDESHCTILKLLALRTVRNKTEQHGNGIYMY